MAGPGKKGRSYGDIQQAAREAEVRSALRAPPACVTPRQSLATERFGVCVDLCRVVHLLAGLRWRPNGRQGSGFDSPWQGGGGTTSRRAPAVVKLLVQRGGLGVR